MEIRVATPEDIQYVSANLRDSDKVEIWASHRRRPEDLPEVCKDVECWVGVDDNVPFCLFGCNDADGYGSPWLLATDAINFHSIWFLKQSKRLAKLWLWRHGKLTNYIHAENETSILWLIWLGFSFPESVMFNGVKFLRFEKRGVNHV